MKRFILTILINSILAGNAFAQDYPRNDIDQSGLAELFGFQDSDINYESLYENMMLLLSHPININKVRVEELRFLNILSETQIQSLIQYRKENGELLSIYELQAIPEFDLITIHKLIPFVEVRDPSTIIGTTILKRVWDEENNYFIARHERTIETKEGYKAADPERKFRGSADKTYYRFRTSQPGDFSFGFTAEKDAGEEFKWNKSSKQYGFDFLSGHAQIQNKGKLKNLIIGDYQHQFGQGLIMGGAFGMGKGAETITTTRRSNVGMLPNTSANEFGLLRGISGTYEIARHVFISGFYSAIKRDATVGDNENQDSGATAFQTSGMHRSNAELKSRKKIGEQNEGLVIQYTRNHIDVGAIYNHIKFDQTVVANDFLYNKFAFHGKQNENIGLFFNYTLHNFLLFGEGAKTLNGGSSHVMGVIGSLTNKLDISLLYRKYDRNFHTFYSNAFSEGTTPQNETGIYWGWKYRWNRKLTLTGYIDLFQFPWLRFRSYKPSSGHEWLTRLSYQPSKHILIYVQGREEKKVRNTNQDPTLYRTADGVKRNLWINCDYAVSPKLKMKTRAQFSSYQIEQHTTHGFALIQDVSFDIGRFGCSARYALFDTDDFDNRQYTYERDVWLAYSLPSYFGSGIRNFILLEYKVNKQISCWLRYARTRYADRQEIGSGPDKIDGNIKSDLKLQVRLKL